MTAISVRPFRRADRDQLTSLVNAHVAAVVPAASVSVQTLLSQLESEPGEFVVDPWVTQRRTLVAEQRGRVVAAAHLLRYGTDADVGPAYSDSAEIRWLVFWPPAPFWPDSTEAAAALMQGILAQLTVWRARIWYADGALPAPGVYGVPEPWPHLRAAYAAAGFSGGRTETVLLARVDELAAAGPPAAEAQRTLGINGTRFSVGPLDEPVGYLEVDTNLGDAGRFVRGAGWADLGNLEVAEEHRRQGVATALLRTAAAWLQLGGVERLLAYLGPDDGAAEAAFYAASGFTVLTRTVRGLSRDPRSGPRTAPPAG